MTTTTQQAVSVTSTNVTEICVMCNYYISDTTKALRIVFGLVICVANIVCCVALVRAGGMAMTLRYYVVNLTITDMLYGLGFAYHSAVVDIDGPIFKKNTVECKVRYATLSMLSIVTLFIVTTMSMERVIALQFPYKYNHWVTRTTVFCTIAVDWIVPAIITGVSYGMMDPAIKECNFGRFITFESMIIFSFAYFSFMILGVICQLVMLIIARLHIRKILPTLVGDERKATSLRMNAKATTTTLCLALPFIVCASPKVMTYLYLAFNPQERVKLYAVSLLAVTFYINVCNSFLNPLIYCWRVPEIRHQVKRLFCRQTHIADVSVATSTTR